MLILLYENSSAIPSGFRIKIQGDSRLKKNKPHQTATLHIADLLSPHLYIKCANVSSVKIVQYLYKAAIKSQIVRLNGLIANTIK